MSMFVRLATALTIVTCAVTAVAQPAPGRAPDVGAAVAPQSHDERTFVVDRVIAVVDDAIIVQSELRARLAAMIPDLQAITDPKERARRLDKLKTQMLDEMVNEQLIVAASAEARIEVTLDEVNAAVDDIKKQNKLDDAQLAAALAEQGYTMGAYKEDLRRQLLRLRAVNQLVRPKVNTINRAKSGEDFAKIAAEMSDDDATKASAGELGWFERGSINPEWESVVFSMDKGDVRGPISGPQGLHVFLVTDIKRTDLKKFEDLKEQIRADLQRREMDKQTAAWIQELRKKAYIDIKL
ncbi:MAG: peptidylprolyl isomerase [Deltaproteobacteria bacterium]|nr:peptidylprolyl isomerase [Deltaproteobacteria bacterium]